MKRICQPLLQTAWIVLLFLSFSHAVQAAEPAGSQPPTQTLELAVPFTDNMILQRQSDVPVWGFGKPGEKVTVAFAGQTRTAKVNKLGDWMVRLAPLKASSTERVMKVSNASGESISLKGVLVGEVWFSSGQSNMDWLASKSMCRELANTLARSEEEIPIREFNADMGSSLFLRGRIGSEAGWKSSKQAGNFSALSLILFGALI